MHRDNDWTKRVVTLGLPQRTGASPPPAPTGDVTDGTDGTDVTDTLIGESLTDPDRFAGLFDRHADESTGTWRGGWTT